MPFATAAFEAVNLNSFPSFFSLLQAPLKHISIVYGSITHSLAATHQLDNWQTQSTLAQSTAPNSTLPKSIVAAAGRAKQTEKKERELNSAQLTAPPIFNCLSLPFFFSSPVIPPILSSSLEHFSVVFTGRCRRYSLKLRM